MREIKASYDMPHTDRSGIMRVMMEGPENVILLEIPKKEKKPPVPISII